MHSCLGAVKTSMLVVQRAQEAIRDALLAKQSDCTLEETLSSLLDCYIHILTDGKIILYQYLFLNTMFIFVHLAIYIYICTGTTRKNENIK